MKRDHYAIFNSSPEKSYVLKSKDCIMFRTIYVLSNKVDSAKIR